MQDREPLERSTTKDIRAQAADIHSQETADIAAAPARPPTVDDAAVSADGARSTLTFVSDGHRNTDPPVAAGSTFATKYYLERLLGRGAMGAVYLARDLSLERDVAIKILLPAHAADARIVNSFHHEAVAMASVRHLNVVQIYTSGQYAGLLFLVMEYVPGRSVAALIRERFGSGQRIPMDTLLGIIEEAALGLAEMHRRGIFHGDVKPANMLIDENNHVAITDFGLVGSAVAETGEVELLDVSLRHLSGGTPLYIAPELIAGKAVPPEERHLCDVYSFGASVFEMFTGKGPFEGPTVEAILHAHLFAPPPELTELRPDLPATVNPVIRRALAKRPRQRYPNCQELAFAVNRAVHDQAA